MDTAVNALFEILSFSSIIVLIVLGLGIIASMMGIFNFAHGEFVLLGAYFTYVLHGHGLPVALAMALAPLFVGLIGWIVERGIIQWFYARPLIAMLGTYALAVVIRETVRGLLGGLYENVEAPLTGFFVVGGITFPQWRVAIIAITILVIAASGGLLTMTSFGLRVRASLEKSGARPRFRHLDGGGLRRDLHLRRGARRSRRCAGGADLLALRRPRAAVFDPGVSRRHAGGPWHLRRAARRGGRDRQPRLRAAVGGLAGARRGAGFPDRSRVDEIPAGGHRACEAKNMS
jgi:hypothetical protein